MLPFAQIKTVIDWTFRDTRPDAQNGGQNRRAKIRFLADVPLAGQQFVTYDVANDLPDGLPQPVNGVTWPNLPWTNIDAGVNWGNGRVYLFRGSEYARFDVVHNRVDHILPIAGNWPGIPWPNIDAALSWGNGKVYFFRGPEYVRYDIGRDRVDAGYPLSIASHWPGLPWPTIDAAVNWGNGKAYFFSGLEYVQYDIGSDRVDATPQPIVALRIGPSGYSVNDYCASIQAIARSHVGAHYLWGGTGARPDGAEGTLVRPGAVSLEPGRADFNNPSVFAAQCAADPSKGRQVCGGMYDRIPGGGEMAGFPAAMTASVQTYLANLAGQSPDQWQPFTVDPNLTPRRMLEVGVSHNVLGEDCRGKRHFDCVGFVNYCVEMALGRVRPVSFAIDQWAADLSGTVAVAKNAPPHPGDILIQDFHHIGLLGGNGEVIQAAETKSGVIVSTYDSNGWSRRRRFTAALLHP
jgi:cell wall-associated NlpC family hydrolase